MNNELGKIRKEASHGLIEVLFQHLPGGTEKAHETPQDADG
jgi:hypothetical protein